MMEKFEVTDSFTDLTVLAQRGLQSREGSQLRLENLHAEILL